MQAEQHLASKAAHHLTHGDGPDADSGRRAGNRDRRRSSVNDAVVRSRWRRLTESDEEGHAHGRRNTVGHLTVGILVEHVKRAQKSVFRVEKHATEMTSSDAVGAACRAFGACKRLQELIGQLFLVPG